MNAIAVVFKKGTYSQDELHVAAKAAKHRIRAINNALQNIPDEKRYTAHIAAATDLFEFQWKQVSDDIQNVMEGHIASINEAVKSGELLAEPLIDEDKVISSALIQEVLSLTGFNSSLTAKA